MRERQLGWFLGVGPGRLTVRNERIVRANARCNLTRCRCFQPSRTRSPIPIPNAGRWARTDEAASPPLSLPANNGRYKDGRLAPWKLRVRSSPSLQKHPKTECSTSTHRSNTPIRVTGGGGQPAEATQGSFNRSNTDDSRPRPSWKNMVQSSKNQTRRSIYSIRSILFIVLFEFLCVSSLMGPTLCIIHQ